LVHRVQAEEVADDNNKLLEGIAVLRARPTSCRPATYGALVCAGDHPKVIVGDVQLAEGSHHILRESLLQPMIVVMLP
jgi:hypothetical protein